MKIVAGLCFLFVFLGSNVRASGSQELGSCVGIDDSAKRLECYDAFAKRPETSTQRTGSWDVRIKSNPLDDSRTVSLALISETGKDAFGNPMVLIIRCLSNETNLFINWRNYLGDKAMVTTRVGSEKATTQSWTLSTDSQATFYPFQDVGFIQKMMKSNKFVAQVTPYGESPITAVFNTGGLERAIKPLRETCQW